MSKGGARNSKSLSDKIASGTFRKDRHSDLMETSVNKLPEIPPSPDYFDAKHTEKWNRICSILKESGVLTTLDLDTIAIYCQNWVIAQEAWDTVCQQGAVLMIETAAGIKPMRNPAHMVYTESQKVIRQLQEQFGMTPKSRQYLKVEKQKETSGLLAHINRSKTKAV